MAFRLIRHLRKLLDVFGTPSDGQVPRWNEANSRFEFSDIESGGANLVRELADFDDTPDNGAIIYNGGSADATTVGLSAENTPGTIPVRPPSGSTAVEFNNLSANNLIVLGGSQAGQFILTGDDDTEALVGAAAPGSSDIINITARDGVGGFVVGADGKVAIASLPSSVSNSITRVFDIRDYGAVGDGTTDSTSAIQAAVNAIVATIVDDTSGGGVLLIPEGVFITDTITGIKSGFRYYSKAGLNIKGNGPGSILKSKSGDHIFEITDECTHLTIENLVFDGAPAQTPTSSTGIGIFIHDTGAGVSSFKLDKVIFKDCGGNAFRCNDIIWSSTISNVEAHGGGDSQFYIDTAGPVVLFENMLCMAVSATGNAPDGRSYGLEIRNGEPTIVNWNGQNNGPGSGAGGGSIYLGGASTIAEIVGCNFEQWDGIAVNLDGIRYAAIRSCKWRPEKAAPGGNLIGVKAGGTRVLMENCWQAGDATYYTNGCFLHSTTVYTEFLVIACGSGAGTGFDLVRSDDYAANRTLHQIASIYDTVLDNSQMPYMTSAKIDRTIVRTNAHGIYSAEGKGRVYFANDGATYNDGGAAAGTGNSHVWRRHDFTQLASLDAAGLFTATSLAGSGSSITALNMANASSGTLAVARGGTGLSSVALGDVIYASATDTLAKLAGNTTTTRKFMRQTGNGSASAAPAWDTPALSDVSGVVYGSLAADFNSSDDTQLVNVTGFSFAIGANEKWCFEFHCGIGSASASGLRLGINGSQTPTTFRAEVQGNTSGSTAQTQTVLTAYAGQSATLQTVNGQNGGAHVTGCIINGANADTVSLAILSIGAQQVTIKAGSYFIARKIG